jgi:hypothetical protein
VTHALACNVTTTKNNILYVDQQICVREKLEEFKHTQCKQLKIPGDKNIQNDDGAKLTEAHHYRSIVGSMNYLTTWTRPDIQHATNMACRYMQTPTSTHLTAATNILRYLAGTINYALKYDNNNYGNDIYITGYTDADWGGDKIGGVSTSGYCVYINNNLISWNTMKQKSVALSTAEAELMGVTEIETEMLWLIQLLTEMKYNVIDPMIIYCDNQGTVALIHNDVSHARTKHIKIRHFHVRNEVREKRIDVRWVSSQEQTADIFTKSLNFQQFNIHRSKLVYELNDSDERSE